MSEQDIWKKMSKVDLMFQLTYMEFQELKDLLEKKRIREAKKQQKKKQQKEE